MEKYDNGGEMSAPRRMDKIIPYLKVGAGNRYPREYSRKLEEIEALYKAGEIDASQIDGVIEAAFQDVESFGGVDSPLRGSFIKNPGKREAMDNRNLKMNNGGKMYYVTGGAIGEEEELLASLKRTNEAKKKGRTIASLNSDDKPTRKESGFLVEGPDDAMDIERLQMASETTNQVGGVPPQLAKMFLAKRGKPEMKMGMKREKIDRIIPPSPPEQTPDPVKKSVDYSMGDDLESSAVFNRGIAQSGARGEGTTGGFRGVRSDLVQDGMLKERGEVTDLSDLPAYMTEDPTFKNLVAEANRTKYQQDIGRESGRFSDTGGQAAKDLADIMSGRITLEAYKERQNRASASFGYGGKMSFGVSKKRRG